MLPTAFMVCATLDAPTLLKGCAREDGTNERLDEADLARCLGGRDKFMRECAVVASRAFSSTITNLFWPTMPDLLCRPGMEKLYQEAWQMGPLKCPRISQESESGGSEASMCSLCRDWCSRTWSRT